MKTISRIISSVAVVAAAIVISSAFGGSPARAAPERIRLMTWGGHWLDIFRPIAEKYEKETGTKVEFVVQTGAADGMNKLLAQKSNPQVDVWTSIESTAAAAARGAAVSEEAPAAARARARAPVRRRCATSRR